MHIFGEDDLNPETPSTDDDLIIENATDEILDDNDLPAAPEGENTDDDDKPKDEDDGDDGLKDWSVTIGEEEPDEDLDGDDLDAPKDKGDSSVIRDMRKKLKAAERENRRLQEERQVKAETKLPALGKKPELQDFDYDEDEFEEALLKHADLKRQHDAEAEKIKVRQENLQKTYDKRLSTYRGRVEELVADAPEIEEAEETVRAAFDRSQQTVLIQAAEDPAVMVLALGQRPKILEKLKAIDDPVILAATIARMEKDLTVKGSKSMKTKPKPERRVKSGSGKTGGVGDTKLERLRAEAAKTGDMTKVTQYKRELRQANRKKT